MPYTHQTAYKQGDWIPVQFGGEPPSAGYKKGDWKPVIDPQEESLFDSLSSQQRIDYFYKLSPEEQVKVLEKYYSNILKI